MSKPWPAILFMAACGGVATQTPTAGAHPIAPTEPARYTSPVSGAAISLAAYRRLAGLDFDQIVAELHRLGIKVIVVKPGDKNLGKILADAGDALGLYLPPFDPDAMQVAPADQPRLLLHQRATYRTMKRVILHEAAHYFLLSARFPQPVEVEGRKVFAGKRDQLDLVALEDLRKRQTSPKQTVRLALDILITGLRLHTQAFLGEAEAYRLQLDEAVGMLSPNDINEIHAALNHIADTFEHRLGFSPRKDDVVTPCNYQSKMAKLIAQAPAKTFDEQEEILRVDCAKARQLIELVRAHLKGFKRPPPLFIESVRIGLFDRSALVDADLLRQRYPGYEVRVFEAQGEDGDQTLEYQLYRGNDEVLRVVMDVIGPELALVLGKGPVTATGAEVGMRYKALRAAYPKLMCERHQTHKDKDLGTMDLVTCWVPGPDLVGVEFNFDVSKARYPAIDDVPIKNITIEF